MAVVAWGPSLAASAATATGTPFKVGFICECAGGTASSQTLIVPAVSAWASYVNAHGGINGHPIKLYSYQDPGNPGVAETQATNIINDHVDALIDADGSDDASWTSAIEASGIPVVSTGFNSTAMLENKAAFTMAVSENYFADEIAQTAPKLRAADIATFYCSEEAVCAQEVTPIKTAASKLGVNVAYSSSVLASAPNYTAQCLAAKQAGATALFVADAPSVVLSVASSCAAQGYTPNQLAVGGSFSAAFVGQPGMNGLTAAMDVFPFYALTANHAMKTMAAAFRKYQPSILKSSDYNEQPVLGWAAGQLISTAAIAYGIGKNKPITTAAVDASIYALHKTNLGGLVPTMTFTKGKLQNNDCWFWAGIRNNKFTLPYGSTTTCVSSKLLSSS